MKKESSKLKKIIQRILVIFALVLVVASIVVYLHLQTEKPWLAFYIACCGGVLVVNLVIVFIFVRKNMK